MVRTQIQLTEEQARGLRSAAAERGLSVAELIRQSVDVLLSQEAVPARDELRERALRAVGRFRSGTADAAARHDNYLTESYST